MIPKLIIKICIIPLVASFCGGVAETMNDMRNRDLANSDEFVIEEEPPAIKFEELSFINPEPEQDLFVKYFGDEANTMRAICKAENRGEDTMAIGDGHLTFWQGGGEYGMSVGLCQIRIMPTRGITIEQMQIPEENIRYAKLLRDTKSGFNHWTMFKNKEYLKFIN